MSLALRIYRRLAEAFPHEFKLAYGTEVMQLGEDVVDEIARRQGARGLVRLIADIAIRVPLEYLSEIRGDMRYGWRMLIKSPGFALVGIISMGLGIGLTTSIYNTELLTVLRELPAANAKRLVIAEKPVSYYYIEQYREQKSLFAGVAAFQNDVPFNMNLGVDRNARPERVFGQLVSPDYFSVLGVQAQRGRLFSPSMDKPGDAPAVVISDRFWRNRLNSSPDAVGQMIRVNGQTATIVGITPKKFGGAAAESPAEVFVPTTVSAAVAPELSGDVLHQRNAREFLAIMCLAPGVKIDSAEAGLDAITRHLDEQDPSAPSASDKSLRVTLMPAGTIEPLPRELRPVALGFFAVLMGLIMTIACMNLGNMLVARGANRRKEFAIRVSVGASRFRLIRQMMSEGILLSLLGGAAGIGLAYWLTALTSASDLNLETGQPIELTVGWEAAVFAFAIAIVCGVGFSLLPALQATKADATPALKEGSALQFPGHRRFGLRNLLMVTQVAGSLMLLLMTGFLVLGIRQISKVQTSFDPKTMYLLSIDPVRDGYTPEKAQVLFEKLPERLKTVGGVRSVVLAAQSPFSIADRTTRVTAEDSARSSRVQQSIAKETVGSGYFAALSVPVVAGREFQEIDERTQTDASKALPAILNQSAARELFGSGNALGKLVKAGNESYEVGGIVPDLNIGLGNRQFVIYLPLTRRDFARPPAGGMIVMVRADAGADPLAGVRSEMASMDPNLTVFHVQTLSEYLDYSRSEMRSAVRTYGGIGVFGLVLVSIGLAGVTAYAVAQRRKEIGIRTALGATRLHVVRLVLREGTALVGVGTVLGFLGAMLMARVLSAIAHILVEALKVGTTDLRLLVGAPLLLASLAMFACYLPARHAAQIDPLRAIREE
jgi:macrolide transport system ATP-binding/permease protein